MRQAPNTAGNRSLWRSSGTAMTPGTAVHVCACVRLGVCVCLCACVYAFSCVCVYACVGMGLDVIRTQAEWTDLDSWRVHWECLEGRDVAQRMAHKRIALPTASRWQDKRIRIAAMLALFQSVRCQQIASRRDTELPAHCVGTHRGCVTDAEGRLKCAQPTTYNYIRSNSIYII